MSFNSYTPLTHLNPKKIKWNIRVRAQAIWRGITRETKEFRGINLILVDDSGYRIHAFINAKFSNLFHASLEENQIYNISNFIVQEYTGAEFHRCVRYDKHIYFADYTKLEKSSEGGLKIPGFAFDFFNLLDLEKMEGDKRFLCDVAGVIKEQTPLRDYVNDNKEAKKQKKISITDGSCTIKVTFFDEFADSFEEAIAKQTEDSIIIIIASAKISSFQGELTLTNYPATRFYLNCQHKAVENLRLRSEEPGFYKNVEVKETIITEKLSVSEIKALTSEYAEREVKCQVTVKKVQDQIHWYDSICKKCDINIEPQDGRFQCRQCQRHYTLPPRRFRVAILCSDSTGGIPIILGDLEVRRLTGKTVFDVELDMVEGSEEVNFPPILKSFVNKEYEITLKITAENANHESDIYETCDIAIVTDEQFASNTAQTEQSMEAEDDANLTGTELGYPFEEPSTEDKETRSVRTRVRKTPEMYRENADKFTTKTRKMQKDEGACKKSKTPTSQKSTSKKETNRMTETEQGSGNEHMSLKQLTRKQGKQSKK